MVLAGEGLAEGDGGEITVRRREPDRSHPLDELLRLAAVLDQVLDRDHLDLVLLAVGDQVGDAGHRPVLAHDLADHSGRVEAGKAGEVDGGLGLAGALEDSSAPRAQREDVSGLDEVGGPLARVDGDLDRAGAIGRRDPRGDALARLDGDRERGAERRLVPVRHLPQVELLAPLLGETQADEAAPVRRHEVDRVRCGELGRDREVALVLAVGRIHDHDELSLTDVLEGGLDGCERRGLDLHSQIVTLTVQRLPD